MIAETTLGDFCRYARFQESRFIDDPVQLGAIFREYVGIQRTPSLTRTINLVRSLGIKIEAADYLKTGGTNMAAQGCWHIHYSAQDKPATQKFTIFHELFEVIHKNIAAMDFGSTQLKEPQLSRCADRFAASALIPPRFFLNRVNATGCDLVRLNADLELSHQCLLIALGQHLAEIPFIGALYEYSPTTARVTRAEAKDFVATVVVKTPRAGRAKDLCGLQSVPTRKGQAQAGSLVCAAVTCCHPVLWRGAQTEDSPAILVRPLSAGQELYRVILLAVPGEEFGMISPQVEGIEPVRVNGDSYCPAHGKCTQVVSCMWNSRGGYDEHGA